MDIETQHQIEEAWSANQYLNDRGVPTHKGGKKLSLVGRIMMYQKMTHDDAYVQKKNKS